MTLVCKNNYISKTVCVLLVVCLLVSCCLGIKAHAIVAEAGIVVAAAATAVVGTILIGMGINAGNSRTDFNSLVDSCVVHLSDLGFVTADGKMHLTALGGAVATGASAVCRVGSQVINGIRDVIFNAQYGNVWMSPSVGFPSCLISPYSICWDYAKTNHGDDKPSGVLTYYYLSTDGNTYYYMSYYDGYVPIVDDNTGGITFQTSVPVNGVRFQRFIYTKGDVSNCHYCTYDDTMVFPSSWHTKIYGISLASTDKDLNISGAQNLNDTDNFDVIYPGWASNAETVDTNIEQDLDNDGSIDVSIPADVYYPIGVPADGDITDLTQEQAQTGADAEEISNAAEQEQTGEQEGTQDTDWTKKIQIGEASDYTLQLRDFFPFCVPFDLYDMLNVLAAEPVAPQFQWVIPVLGQSYTLNIDLSGFNTVAAIVRTMELLAFAVGLALGTKKLIQGGD